MMSGTPPKSALFLKFIIAYKLAAGTAAFAMSATFIKLINRDVEEVLTALLVRFRLNAESNWAEAVIEKAGLLENATILGISVFMFILGALNYTEAVGLHLKRRWAEWLTVAATGLLIPVEFYEVVVKVSPLKAAILILNCAIVYYLAKHKELFSRKHPRPEERSKEKT